MMLSNRSGSVLACAFVIVNSLAIFPPKLFLETAFAKPSSPKMASEQGVVEILVEKPRHLGDPLEITVRNKTSFNIGMLRFDLQVYGAFTNIEINHLKRGQVKKQRIEGDKWRELQIEHLIVVDSKANRREPKFDIRLR